MIKLISLLIFIGLQVNSVSAEDLYRQKHDPNFTSPPPAAAPPEAQALKKPPPRVAGDELNHFFTEGPKKLREVFEEKKAWLEHTQEASQRTFFVTGEIYKILQDPEIQKATTQLVQRFKFKPLLLSEVLLLILSLIFRASRPSNRSVMIKTTEQLLISVIYLILAFIAIPTIFLGTNYLHLVSTISRRLFVLF